MTATIGQLGEDLNKPVTETMTEADYIDEWSRMTPKQRDLCMKMGCAMYIEFGMKDHLIIGSRNIKLMKLSLVLKALSKMRIS